MLRKPRIQPKLASLTAADKDTLADWLRQGDYDDVLARVKKPRDDGGFGLTDISKGPLQTFYAKVALLDVINSRLSPDKRMTIAEFESISNGDLLLASSANSDINSAFSVQPLELVSEDVHSAIMSSTYDLATSGDNKPTDLLALQRLADFPARAEYRAHKVEMDLHRKHMAEERLTLAKLGFELREKQLALRADKNSNFGPRTSPLSDSLGQLALNGDDIERRTCKKFNLPYTPNEQGGSGSDAAADLQPSRDHSQPTGKDDFHGVPNKSSVDEPAAAPLINTAIHGGESTTPKTTSVSTLSEPQLPNPNSQLPVTNAVPASASSVVDSPSLPSIKESDSSPATLLSSNPTSSTENSVPTTREAPESTSHLGFRPSDLVISHAIRRWRAHIRRPEGTPEPDGSWRDECPCGNPLPCVEHPELYARVKYYRPQNPDFRALLKEAGIPYYIPTAEELGCSQEELDKSRDPFGYIPQIPGAHDPRFDLFHGLPLGPAMQSYKDRHSEI